MQNHWRLTSWRPVVFWHPMTFNIIIMLKLNIGLWLNDTKQGITWSNLPITNSHPKHWRWQVGFLIYLSPVCIWLKINRSDHDKLYGNFQMVDKSYRISAQASLFRRRSKKTPKLRVTGLCAGNSPGPVNSPHKGPVTGKMFPFDDVIMTLPLHQIHICASHATRYTSDL